MSLNIIIHIYIVTFYIWFYVYTSNDKGRKLFTRFVKSSQKYNTLISLSRITINFTLVTGAKSQTLSDLQGDSEVPVGNTHSIS